MNPAQQPGMIFKVSPSSVFSLRRRGPATLIVGPLCHLDYHDKPMEPQFQAGVGTKTILESKPKQNQMF
jgi:hypothetical protein